MWYQTSAYESGYIRWWENFSSLAYLPLPRKRLQLFNSTYNLLMKIWKSIDRFYSLFMHENTKTGEKLNDKKRQADKLNLEYRHKVILHLCDPCHPILTFLRHRQHRNIEYLFILLSNAIYNESNICTNQFDGTFSLIIDYERESSYQDGKLGSSNSGDWVSVWQQQ